MTDIDITPKAPIFHFPPEDLLRHVLSTLNTFGWDIFDVECTACVGLHVEQAAITARFTERPRVHALRIVERIAQHARFRVTIFPHRLPGDFLSPVGVEEMKDGMLASSARAKAIQDAILLRLQQVQPTKGKTP